MLLLVIELYIISLGMGAIYIPVFDSPLLIWNSLLIEIFEGNVHQLPIKSCGRIQGVESISVLLGIFAYLLIMPCSNPF